MKEKITITDKGIVDIPNQVQMSIAEIANLFDIYYQPTKRIIRAIEKVGIITGNYTNSCILEGNKVHPEYYGLEMIVAISFQVQSEKAKIFRNWLFRRLSKTVIPEMLIIDAQNPIWN
ncbi:hypothetical protein [Dysgonomonas sp. Marseille-P4361]|uniref:hypothetical protein n=1 Tax=Dysgonomonas sp. Marseille-P4361 TaxID=2161820 RepID=UPI000D5515BA|nr:hypothetical protein [Dysgonomonas sp. Marseille-P4361]